MITIADIKNDFERYITLHPQLQGFGFGDINNISTKEHKFPLLWMQPVVSQFIKNIEVNSFDIYILDVQEHNQDNIVKVLSDTNIFTNDTIGYILDDINNKLELDNYLE